ncbi:MAG TPA: HTTM domain-containing protein [Planctomycetota bacterium]|nr:HTTM domain-containing protein [Planctomycetota bacterium]
MSEGKSCDVFNDEIAALGTDRRKRSLSPPTEPIDRRGLYLHRVLGLDLRSLALFRVFIALVILADLANRARWLVAHYTDAGVLPRADSVALTASPWQWSLHLASGAWPLQALLFALAAGFAVMLLFGWKTRLATVASWLLLASLHGRNHLVLQGGDVLLRCLLFWAMFLPLGACWSLDRARRSDDWPVPRSVLSFGTAAFVLQLAMMYIFSGFLKHHRIWTEGDAGWYALSIDQLATPFAGWMLGHPDLLRWSTLFILWFERLAPIMLLIVSMQGVRLLTVVVFFGAHAAMWACLELGPFPFVCWAAWCALLPTAFWDRLLRSLRKRPRVHIWYDGECGACWAVARVITTMVCPGAQVDQAQDDPEVHAEMRLRRSWLVDTPDQRRHHGFAAVLAVLRYSPIFFPLAWLLRPFSAIGERLYRRVSERRSLLTPYVRFLAPEPLLVYGRSRAAQAVCAYFLILVALWNWRTLEWSYPRSGGSIGPAEHLLPRDCNWLVELPRLDQYWSMFAPHPLLEDGWYDVPATLADGDEVDLLSLGPPTSAKPALVSAGYDGERWRKYLMNIASREHRAARDPFARWLRGRWDAQHPPDRQVARFEIAFWIEPTTPDGPPPLRREVLWTSGGK